MRLYNDDCLNVLKNIEDESIDCVVTDCPYHIVSGGCTNIPRQDETGGILNKRNTFTQANAKTGKLFDNNEIEFKDWLPDIYRVLKQGTHCYIMINARNLKELQQEAENVGFEFQNILIWYKQNATPNRYYLNAYEMILMLKKGNARNINNMGCKNVLEIANILDGKTQPTEKPVRLNEILIANSTNKGEVVLDPFMGTGSCGVAAKKLGRDFIGIEIDEKYYNIAKDRIENNYREQIELFDCLEVM